MKPQLCDSYFLHLKGGLALKIRSQQPPFSLLYVFFVSGKMAMILGFIFLCILQASVPQGLTPRGPRPIPGRGDRPEPTPPPIQPVPTPGPQGCKSEFY